MEEGQPKPKPKPRARVIWNLYPLMAERRIRYASDLTRRLAEVGVNLTPTHVARIVSKPPERLSLELLEGLLTVLDCSPNDLIRVERARYTLEDPKT